MHVGPEFVRPDGRSHCSRLLHSHAIVWFVCAEAKGPGHMFGHLDFKIAVEPPDAAPFTVVLLAPSRQEKAAWMSDISQCVDNIRCNGLMTIVFEENSKVTVPHMIK